MDQGWIYVLVNSSIPGMAKVGRTTRQPSERVAELSAATGVATPFVLAFDQAVADCCATERAVHDELDRRGLRVAPNREFFRGSPSEIIRVVLEAADKGCDGQPETLDGSAASLLTAGDRCLFGLGDTMQDTGEAIRLYKLASARGSLVAFERLGRIFNELYAARRDRPGRRRALGPLKEGARRGNFYCYAEMAILFAGERHLANFEKAWSLFFAQQTTDQSTETECNRMATACCRYIAACLELGIDPKHRYSLTGQAESIIAALLAELDLVRDLPTARQRVAKVLRWCYETLLPGTVQTQHRRKWGFEQFVWLPYPQTAPA